LNVKQTDRTRRIRELEAEADQTEGRTDELRWNAARLYAEELEAGTSSRDLAEAVGKSHTHVLRMRAIWREHGPGYERRKPGVSGAPFSRIYYATKVPIENPPGPRTDRRWFLSALKRIDKRVGFIEPVALEPKDAEVAARLLEKTIVRLQALLDGLRDARPEEPAPAPKAHLRAVGDNAPF